MLNRSGRVAVVNPPSLSVMPSAPWLALLVLIGACVAAPVRAESPSETGEVRFEPPASEATLPDFFQLQPHTFRYERTLVEVSTPRAELSLLTFPSPVATPHEANNTVHCEYFRPSGAGRRPAVVVLHILGGDFELARFFCSGLATRNVAALFLKMPYYGPRRPPDSPARMISSDPQQTVAGMRQAVLDIRRAAAWLAARDEVDPQQLGIFGISLGGITGALAASIEPRFAKGCFMLAGGDIGQVAWSNPKLDKLRGQWVENGGTKESFFELLKSVDPVTYAHRLQGRQILMLNASRDEVIPKSCTESLWKACGEPEIVWYDAGHYTAVRYIFDGLGRVTNFFQPAPAY